jgi:hypothetical protein
MRITEQSTKVVTLSQPEAQVLLRLLDRLASQADRDERTLSELHQRLSDSAWLAGWLRENVTLHLSNVETIDLAEAVLVMLDRNQWSEGDCQTLESFVSRLTMAHPTSDTSGGILARQSAITETSYCHC